MRKQTKFVAVLSAAALLAIGASMTSFAATGWQEENGAWVYYDRNGDQVTDQWAKSGNNWFYLNSDGEMATDELIDDGTNYYYVDSNGAMVANQWVAVANENAGEEDEPESYWYYFQNSGKAYKAGSSGATSFKTINGKKYAFQDDAKMLYGWINDSASRETGDTAWQNGTYFCGDENDGAQGTGWAKISVVDTENEDSEDQDYWFYFNPSNGKKTTDNASKSINGKKYAFNDYGVMQSEWYWYDASASDATSSIAGYHYYNEPDQGWRLQKGWTKVVPQEDVNNTAYNDESTKWFYAENNGDLVANKLKTINGKKYAFNAKGEMLSGLWLVKAKSSGEFVNAPVEVENADVIDKIKENTYPAGDGWEVYYFGSGDDGAAKTGNQTIDVDGDTYSYTFGTTGSSKFKGLDGVNKNTTLYVQGLKIKAETDYRYQAFTPMGVATVPTVAPDKNTQSEQNLYLINASGSLMKNKTNIKDSDDNYYCTNAAGKVTYYSQDKYEKK
ncbi:hypothetical protein [Hungatella effluvii]|uniref:hypothetical protein n=3 Tax=Hungatella TaxID=1649459 RepID=UPI0022E83392|nr:hypothetical protein [Hungatella effluvii]